MNKYQIFIFMLLGASIYFNWAQKEVVNNQHSEINYVSGYAFCKCLQETMPENKFDALMKEDCSFSLYWDAVQSFTNNGAWKSIDSLAMLKAIEVRKNETLDRPCTSSILSDCLFFSQSDQVKSYYNGYSWLEKK